MHFKRAIHRKVVFFFMQLVVVSAKLKGIIFELVTICVEYLMFGSDMYYTVQVKNVLI